MILSKRIVWDAATCGGTLKYQHDEPTSFFFFIPMEAAHLRLPRSTSSTWRMSRCQRFFSRESGRRGWRGTRRLAGRLLTEKVLTARKSATGTAPEISAQLAEREVQLRDRAGLAKVPLHRRRATKAPVFRSSPSVVSYFSEFHFFYFSIRAAWVLLHFSGGAAG